MYLVTADSWSSEYTVDMGHLSTEQDKLFNMVDEKQETNQRDDINVESLGSSSIEGEGGGGGSTYSEYTEEEGAMVGERGGESGESGAESDEMFYVGTDFLPSEFRELSVEVAQDIVGYICRRSDAAPARCKTATIMRSLVDDALLNRLDFMRDLVLRVSYLVLIVTLF